DVPHIGVTRGHVEVAEHGEGLVGGKFLVCGRTERTQPVQLICVVCVADLAAVGYVHGPDAHGTTGRADCARFRGRHHGSIRLVARLLVQFTTDVEQTAVGENGHSV